MHADADVVIVGYGPVGQTLAILLAQRGRRTIVVERWPRPYAMPRAVAFDSESARILAAAGLADYVHEFSEPSGEYRWLDASGRTLLSIEASEQGRCGWPDSLSMYQPGLEAALAARAARLPTLDVRRGVEAVAVAETPDGVELTVRESGGAERDLTAGWVVGCDGANSFVRAALGATSTDSGFSHDWLICDVVPAGAAEFRPNNLQICDPVRPTTHVSAGPGHRRWEFMRVAGESVADLDRPEIAWELLARHGVTPDNAVLERHAVYTFDARVADRWRAGRLLVAGDAAHVMPPFAAQGMCSGFRDAANLAWKLDLVLAGTAGAELLDSYEVERRRHVRHAVRMSVDLGKVICQDDPVAAADRDTVMIAARRRGIGGSQPKAAVWPLVDGFLHRDADGRVRRPAGELAPQGRVTRGARTALLDDIVGPGFVLLAAEPPRQLLADRDRRVLDALGVRVVHVLPAGTAAGEGEVADTDGVLLDHLAETGSLAVFVRPDFYVYGGAADAAGVAALVDGLRSLSRKNAW